MSKKIITIIIIIILVLLAGYLLTNKEATPTTNNLPKATPEQKAEIEQEGGMVLNLENSKLEWRAGKAGGSEHYGQIVHKDAVGDMEDGTITRGDITMYMDSLTVEDLTNEKMNESLTNHLKGEDFFEVETYPTATFSLTNPAIVNPDGTTILVGDMTIKGITKEITVPATVVESENTVTISGSIELKRQEWNIGYLDGKILDNIKDSLINDEIYITTSLEFLK